MQVEASGVGAWDISEEEVAVLGGAVGSLQLPTFDVEAVNCLDSNSSFPLAVEGDIG